MQNFEIRKFRDPVLKRKSKKITSFDEDLGRFIFDMKQAMARNEGIGLAAPQVGVNKRIVVYKDAETHEIKELINPKIIKKAKEKDVLEEGCLSFPGVYLKIKRPISIEVSGFNSKGENILVKAQGINARVIQHEIDHLNGVLFYERLPFGQRIKFKIFHKWD